MSVSMKRSAAALAAIVGAVALMPTAASAQSYGSGSYGYNQGYQGQSYQNQSYQSQGYSQPYGHNQVYGNTGYQNRDRCQTLGQGRTGAGALIGAGIGAVAGSQIAARGNRTEGSVIGGVLGAIVGAQVGRASNSQCQSTSYASNGYTSNGYGGSAYAPPATYYGQQDRHDDRAQSYGRYDDRRNDNRRDDRHNGSGYQVSADGHYYFDPRRGWLPR